MADRLPRGHQPDPSGYTSPTSPTGRYHPGGGLAQPQHSYGPSTYDPRGAPTPSSRPPPRAHPTEHVSWSDSPPQGGGQFRGQGQQQRPPVPSKKPSAAGTDSLLPVDPLHYNDGSAAATAGADFRRKKSLVRPERERDDPTARNFHYRQHAAQMEESGGRVGVIPSSTGNVPARIPLRRGKSILAREEDEVRESGLSLFKRGGTLRRKPADDDDAPARAGLVARQGSTAARKQAELDKAPEDRGFWGGIAPGPVDGWMIYCFLITCWVPIFIMKYVFGKHTREAQRAWREKIGLLTIILSFMGAVGFITFGFTQTVCGTPANRYKAGSIENGSLIINGLSYDFSNFSHPAGGVFNGSQNPLFMDSFKAGGQDASFLFQNVNRHCLGVITPAANTAIQNQGEELAWYFPCNLRDQNGLTSPNLTNYTSSYMCHTKSGDREALSKEKAAGQVFYEWEDIKNPNRNLAVYQSNVIDMDLLKWLDSSQVQWPAIFDYMKSGNETYRGLDLTMLAMRENEKRTFNCLTDVATVGFISGKTIGCIASDIVLYVSLIFIIGVVGAKFAMAVAFGWFISWRLGSFKGESYAQRMARSEAIENWTDDIYRSAPSRYRPNVARGGGKGEKSRGGLFLPTTSRFSKADMMMVTASRPSTTYGGNGAGGFGRSSTTSTYGAKGGLLSASPLGGGSGSARPSPPGSPMLHSSPSQNSLPYGNDESYSDPTLSHCPFPLHNVIPQPPPDYEPFNFPLIHNMMLVTAYSESIEGLRTTLDSLATTDYPNSHKVILVIADGMVRGSGSKLRTPDIVLSMIKDLVIPAEEVEAHSYVAIADGHKRHNMAKVYAGFYDYDDNTVEISKQQRVPIILVAKVGNPLEAHEAKPGNRGKRDSQVVLMSFLQKVMFDERMTTFEYEFFNSLWRVTGVSPDQYQAVLCVDADTKVFPDSLTRMTAAFNNDPEIMALCGETKIANKAETWVTMIQVFEYYISHHQAKAFEAVFGGVTCLPGCFSMYRIKAPKGDSGYWVPILANPDIIEHYSENIVDTLHKKNLLLLGEDRYLSTLLLKTFPKRKMSFIPQAVCKTVVPDTFRILLSQRRRWINSTIHNLFELLFVRDLCGTFCFSMQFVVFMELIGTLVLPAAIAFTIYLIVVAILPSQPTPTIPLILLAIILGLPGLLIVITSRKIAYVGWMLIYLLSLPLWNGVLPAYSYWHFDDFSWGETRKIEGETKETSHGDKEGVFDSSSIVMRRWAEFERERRWKSGMNSRDSYYGDLGPRSGSPSRAHRYSMASTETYTSGHPMSDSTHTFAGRPSHSFNSGSMHSYGPNFNSSSSLPTRADSVPLLELPTPLGARSNTGTSSSTPPTDDNGGYAPRRIERSFTASSTSGGAGGLSGSQESAGSQGPFQDQYGRVYSPEEMSSPDFSHSPTSHYDPARQQQQSSAARGINLIDEGFLPPQQQNVRRVARNAQRRVSGTPNGAMAPPPASVASSHGGGSDRGGDRRYAAASPVSTHGPPPSQAYQPRFDRSGQ